MKVPTHFVLQLLRLRYCCQHACKWWSQPGTGGQDAYHKYLDKPSTLGNWKTLKVGTGNENGNENGKDRQLYE